MYASTRRVSPLPSSAFLQPRFRSPPRSPPRSLSSRAVAPSLSLSLLATLFAFSFARLALFPLSSPLILRLSVSRALSARVYKPCVAIYIKRRSVSLCRFAGTRASASGFGGGGRGGRGRVRRGFSLSRATLALRRGENHPKILECERWRHFGPVAACTSANSR